MVPFQTRLRTKHSGLCCGGTPQLLSRHHYHTPKLRCSFRSMVIDPAALLYSSWSCDLQKSLMFFFWRGGVFVKHNWWNVVFASVISVLMYLHSVKNTMVLVMVMVYILKKYTNFVSFCNAQQVVAVVQSDTRLHGVQTRWQIESRKYSLKSHLHTK